MLDAPTGRVDIRRTYWFKEGTKCDDGDVAESDVGAYALDPGGIHADGALLESDSNDFMVLEHCAVTHRMLQ